MITLYTFGPYFGLPDGSPFVTKTMLLLKFAGLPYQENRQGCRANAPPADRPKPGSPQSCENIENSKDLGATHRPSKMISRLQTSMRLPAFWERKLS
ncbi:MAG: hypothetical protein ACLQFI_19590 [Methylocella sp.]